MIKFENANKRRRPTASGIAVLPYIEKIEAGNEDKEKPFVSHIQKPKPKRNEREKPRIFFIKS